MSLSLVRKPSTEHQIGDVKTSILTEVEFQSLYGTSWALMDGRNIAGTDLAVLTGLTTLPDARGRAMICAGTYTDPVSGSISRTLRATLGAEAHILAHAQMPGHQHATMNHRRNAGGVFLANFGSVSDGGAGTWNEPGPAVGSGFGGDNQLQLTAGANGATDQAHNNMPPSVVMNMFVKVNK